MRKLTQRTYTLNTREASALVVYAMQSGWGMSEVLSYAKNEYLDVDVLALELLLDCMGGLLMARGGKNGTAQVTEQWTRFVEISLAGTTQSDIEAVYGDVDAVGVAVDGLLMNGYRLGLSWNGQRQAYIASLTCKDPGSPNSGCTVTAFAGTWWEAIAVVCYKHYVVAKEDWSTLSGQSPSGSFG